MRTSLFRRFSAVAAASALCVSLGLASADAVAPKSAAPTGTSTDSVRGPYISPWGDAEVELGDESLQWMEREGITIEAIHPFKMDADGQGFTMPIGSTEGDHLDARGRIFYPGGLRFHHAESGMSATLKPTWIRLMPRPGYSAGVSVDGKKIREELQIGDTRIDEVMTSARPSPTGWRLKKVPFYVTQEVSDLFSETLGRPGPRPGSLLGTLTPDFRYVPTQSPGLPGLPG